MNSIKINGKASNINKILLSLFLKGVSIVKPNKILKDYVKVKNKDLIITDNKKIVSYKNPKKYQQNNVINTINLLECMKDLKMISKICVH